MRKVLVLAVLAVAAAEDSIPKAKSKGTPILSTDIFHRTAELFYDLYDSFHGKFLKPHIDKHAATVSSSVSSSLAQMPDVVDEACKVLSCDAAQVKAAGGTAQEKLKEHAGQALSVLSQVEEVLNRYTNTVIDGFETALPKYAGLISRTPMNLMLFVLYIFSVMYFLFKAAMLSMWLASALLCCLCCCGCCCCRKKPQVAESKAKNAKDAKAVEKGKAATNAKPKAKK